MLNRVILTSETLNRMLLTSATWNRMLLTPATLNRMLLTPATFDRMGHRFDTINAVQEVTYAEQNVACISSTEQNVTDIKTQN